MSEFPFSVTIKRMCANGDVRSVTCIGLLRSLGRKRQVYDALWDGRPVILKVFSDRLKAKYHMNREWRGLKLLEERGLNSPAPLFKGRSEDLGWAVVTEKISDGKNLREVWDSTTDFERKQKLLYLVSRELAKEHGKGVLQRDLHLGNFMIQAEKTFALDPSQMRFLSGAVGKRRAISQLALLASAVAGVDSDTMAEVCGKYVQMRSWEFGPSDIAAVRRKSTAYIRKGIKRALRKCLRTNRRYRKIEEAGYLGAGVRELLEKLDVGDFVEKIDSLMEGGRTLKNGNTCSVSRLELAGEEVVIKRYNHKGIVHSLRHTMKGSRARRCWVHAHRLTLLNIATPKPLAYLEHRKGPIVWKSYFITEHVEGQKLGDFLRDDTKSHDERTGLTKQLREVLEKLDKYHISHGDLKHTNILVTENGPVLTDLDSVRRHASKYLFEIRAARDRERMVYNGTKREVKADISSDA